MEHGPFSLINMTRFLAAKCFLSIAMSEITRRYFPVWLPFLLVKSSWFSNTRTFSSSLRQINRSLNHHEYIYMLAGESSWISSNHHPNSMEVSMKSPFFKPKTSPMGSRCFPHPKWPKSQVCDHVQLPGTRLASLKPWELGEELPCQVATHWGAFRA